MLHAGKSIARATLLGLAGATSLVASQTVAAADGIKAAYVETVIPSKSYSGQGTIVYSNTAATMGPSQTGVLGLGSIVLTNFGSQTATLMFAGVNVLVGVCGSSDVAVSYTSQPIYLIVPPQSTLVVPFPTPYVINPAGGQACVFVEYTSVSPTEELQVTVTGLVN